MTRLVFTLALLLGAGCVMQRGPSLPMSFFDSEGRLVKCRMERPLGSNIAKRICERVSDASTPSADPNVELVRPRASPTKGN